LGAHETYTPVLDHRFDAVGGERRQNVERRVHRSITVVPGVLLAPECGVLFASVSSAPSEPVDSSGKPLFRNGVLSGADGADAKSPPLSGSAVMQMKRLRLWFVSLSKAISMPALRRKVAARRRRPERVLGVLGQLLLFRCASLTSSVRAPRRSEAVPVHFVRVAMSARTALATGSASMTSATASSRLPEYAVQNVPAGQIAVSQAVAHSAKSAIRGNSSRRVSGKRFRPSTTTSSSAPKMYGRSTSNAVH